MNREYQLVVNSRCQQRGFDEFDVESEKIEAVPSQRGRGPFPLTKRITFEKQPKYGAYAFDLSGQAMIAIN